MINEGINYAFNKVYLITRKILNTYYAKKKEIKSKSTFELYKLSTTELRRNRNIETAAKLKCWTITP